MIVGLAMGTSNFVRVSWNSGVKLAFPSFGVGVKSGLKLMQTAKVAKALNILGAVDFAGGLLVKSDVDKGWWSLIPGSGLVELGAAVVSKITGESVLGAKFAWEEGV